MSRFCRRIFCLPLTRISDDEAKEEEERLLNNNGFHSYMEDEDKKTEIGEIEDENILPVNKLALCLDKNIRDLLVKEESKHALSCCKDEDETSSSTQKGGTQLKDLVRKVMEENRRLLHSSDRSKSAQVKDLFDLVMLKRHEVIEEENIESVDKLKDVWESGAVNRRESLIDREEAEANKDIAELAELLDTKNEEDLSLKDNNEAFEQTVINELGNQIEEKFMLSLAREESFRNLNKSLEIVTEAWTRNPRSSTINKRKDFKTVISKVQEVMKQRDELIDDDNMETFDNLKGLWEAGNVSGDVESGRRSSQSKEVLENKLKDLSNASKRSLLVKRDSIKAYMKKKKEGNVKDLVSKWSSNS